MTKETILLVDDDQDIQNLQRLYLQKEGFRLLFANSGKKAIEMATEHQPSLIILDVNLPDLDGFEVCQSLRQYTKVPILFVTGRSDDVDTILGHRIGGDDYIYKPFNPGVLVAKVKAHLRRYRELTSRQSEPYVQELQQALTFGNLVIEKEQCAVKKNGKEVTLSTKEFLLLCFLAENPNRVFSLEHIFDQIWGEESLGDYRTVMVHISNLRKKIEKDPSKPELILTIRGLGYKFSGG
ncbi:response regulator transcription factor [Cytobacillus gottheilii]|uniref:response regulator transcription factor n=1 Tax=Cytobacillus gottheilii TaxID=859144 RepID=UPI0009BBAF92|nr:response regulator transcription factor [Cytobacillus gottheilii]